MIGRRIGRLSSECSRVLTLASVIGREFSLDAIEGLAELSGDELLDVLDEAVEARVLAAVPGSPGRLRFGHALIRQTLYDQLSTPRRVQLHRRAGGVLESLYSQDPEPHLSELAYHFFESAPGGDIEKALDYAPRAGDRALRQLAYEEAARFYRLALQALELSQSVEPEARCELLLATGDALARAGNTPEAQDTFADAADLARVSRMPKELARAALGYGGRFPWLRAGDDERLVPLLEEALEALGDAEPVLRVRLLARLAGALRDQPSLEPRSSLSREAVEIARELGDPYTLGYALVSQFTATWGPDSDLIGIAEEVTQLAEQADDLELALDACFLRREASLEVGDEDRIAAATVQHRALADELRQPQQQWYDVVMSSNWALFRGDFAEAERQAEEALRLGKRAVESEAWVSYRLTQFGLRRERGGLEEIEELIRRGVHDHPGYRCFDCLVALLDCELGRQDAARTSFDDLAAHEFADFPRDSEWLFRLSILAEVAALLGDRDRSATLHGLLLPYPRLNAVASGEIAIGCVARYLGITATTTERWEAAERHFRDALEINADMTGRPWVAHTQHDNARMLLARNGSGDRARADELLASALETYRELGMKPWIERAQADARGPLTDEPGIEPGRELPELQHAVLRRDAALDRRGEGEPERARFAGRGREPAYRRAEAPSAGTTPEPETRYAVSGNVRVAYQVVGDGPRDLVVVPGLTSHLELTWEYPPYERFVRRLATFARVILFDKRGAGLSDPIGDAETLEERIDDIRAVMDAAGSQRADVFGWSDGAVIATVFGASRPDRVSALVLYGSCARSTPAEGYPWAPAREEWEPWLQEGDEESWGTGLSLRRSHPAASRTRRSPAGGDGSNANP